MSTFTDLAWWKQKTLIAWQASDQRGDDVVPCYCSYDMTWRNAGQVNPFTYDWALFDPSDLSQLQYMERVVRTMDEQIVIWGVDEPTSKRAFFLYFIGYTETLRWLFCCIIGGDWDFSIRLGLETEVDDWISDWVGDVLEEHVREEFLETLN